MLKNIYHVTLVITGSLQFSCVCVCACVQCGACCCVRNWTAHHVAVFSSMVTCRPQVKT